jgi:hypothetical protein
MKRFMNKKVATIGLAAGLALGAAGAAFAYFTTTGDGNGSATTGSGSTVSLVQDTSVVTADLTPGGASQDIIGHQHNAAGDTEFIGTVSVDFTGTVWQTDGTYTCSAADYNWTGSTVNTDETSGPAGTQATTSGNDFQLGTLSFNDNPVVDQSACKGQVLDLHFSSN